jgi:hypothetical protein
MTATEAAACMRSGDPRDRQRLREHLDTLEAELDSGNGIRTTPRELMAAIRAELGISARE